MPDRQGGNRHQHHEDERGQTHANNSGEIACHNERNQNEQNDPCSGDEWLANALGHPRLKVAHHHAGERGARNPVVITEATWPRGTLAPR